MATDSPDPRMLRKIDPLRVVDYAAATGWLRVSNKRTDVAVLKAGQLEQLIVPLNPLVDDFQQRMEDVVARLSRHEKRTISNIINTLLVARSDILRFRLDDAATNDGSISFSAGRTLLETAEKSLRSAACSVKERTTFHKRLSKPDSDLLVENARLGQTERGSYIALVIVPLDSVPDDSHQMRMFDAGATVPFARQATSLLMRSVESLRKNIVEGTAQSLITPSGEGDAVTANLCEALAAIRPESSDGLLEISATWEPTVQSIVPLPTSVSLPSGAFSEIERIAGQLRPVEQPRSSRFIGKVTKLAGRPSADDGKMSGEISFQFQEEDRLLTAKVILDAVAYAVACDAHKADAFVSIEGSLLFRSRLHQIEVPQNFRLLGQT